MPSLRYRRADHASRRTVVFTEFAPPLSRATSQGSWRSTSRGSQRGSCISNGDSSGMAMRLRRGSCASDGGSVISICAGQNALEYDPIGGGYRPGGLLSSGKCPVLIDAAISVYCAPNNACRGMQIFAPRWKGELNARERYNKPLGQRHVEGSLRAVTALGRTQNLPHYVPSRLRGNQ
jgi:hypothetical protein